MELFAGVQAFWPVLTALVGVAVWMGGLQVRFRSLRERVDLLQAEEETNTKLARERDQELFTQLRELGATQNRTLGFLEAHFGPSGPHHGGVVPRGPG